jgi:uncharacterized protein (TIGR03435 family)
VNDASSGPLDFPQDPSLPEIYAALGRFRLPGSLRRVRLYWSRMAQYYSQEDNTLIAIQPNRLLLLAAAMMGIADAQPKNPLTFEVASIKLHKPDNGRPSMPQFLPGGRFSCKGVPLRIVIAIAWNVGFQSVRLTEGPAWINSMDGLYDIEAKAPEGAIPAGLPSNIRDQRTKLMLQALLEDRFKLKIRRETKEMPIYAVVIAKNGLKLEKAAMEEKDCPETTSVGVSCHTIMGGRGRGLHGQAVSLSDVLSYVENWTDRPLVDKTGLQGLFKIETKGWRDLQPGPQPPPGAKGEDGTDLADIPDLFTVFDRIGLKLQPQKGTAEIFVIEHVERPSDN